MIADTRLKAARAAIRRAPLRPTTGRVAGLKGPVIRARLAGARVGGLCWIDCGAQPPLRAEVVGVDGPHAVMSPFGTTEGLTEGAAVRQSNGGLSIAAGPGLLGRIVDAFGVPVDGQGPLAGQTWRAPIRRGAPEAVARPLVEAALNTGIRAIDAMATLGRGQRLAIFGPPGTGKSSLLASIARGAAADVIVIGLVGERGREVREFTAKELPAELRARVVCVAATSDRPASERILCAQSATAIAEFFRDRGNSVLLMIDSITRTARALREVGLAAGEAPTRRGYPASVYPALPAIIERAGRTEKGDITALYTVLVEDEGEGDPIADEVRSLTDGHLTLSRKLAESGHWPAIDVLDSLSRLMATVAPREQIEAAALARRHLAKYRDIELLLQVGQYAEGVDREADAAIKAKPALDRFLRQNPAERVDPAAMRAALREAVR
ncbi:MAG: FliI/YscN family ATPase [Pseudomonadota bacterium]